MAQRYQFICCTKILQSLPWRGHLDVATTTISGCLEVVTKLCFIVPFPYLPALRYFPSRACAILRLVLQKLRMHCGKSIQLLSLRVCQTRMARKVLQPNRAARLSISEIKHCWGKFDKPLLVHKSLRSCSWHFSTPSPNTSQYYEW